MEALVERSLFFLPGFDESKIVGWFTAAIVIMNSISKCIENRIVETAIMNRSIWSANLSIQSLFPYDRLMNCFRLDPLSRLFRQSSGSNGIDFTDTVCVCVCVCVRSNGFNGWLCSIGNATLEGCRVFQRRHSSVRVNGGVLIPRFFLETEGGTR